MTDIIISTPVTNVSVGADSIDVSVGSSDIVTAIIGIPGGLNVLGNQTWQDGALIYFDQDQAQFNQDAGHIKWDKADKKLVVSGNATAFTVDTPSNFAVNINYGTGSYYDYSYYNFEFAIHAYKDTSLGRVYSSPSTVSVSTSASYQNFNFSLSWDLVSGADGYVVLVKDPYMGYTSGEYGFDAGIFGSITYDYYNPALSYYGYPLLPTTLSGIADPLEMVTGGIEYGSGVDLNNNDFNFISLGANNKSYLGWDHTNSYIKATNSTGGLRTIRANINADNVNGSVITGTFYGSNYGTTYGAVYLGSGNKVCITNGYGQAAAASNIQIQPTYGLIEQKAGNSTRYVNVHGVLYDVAGSINNSGTTETDLVNYSLPANMFNYDGQKVLFEYSGNSANNANGKTIRIYFGTTVIFNSGAMTNSAAGNWVVQGRIIRKNSSTIAYRVSLMVTGMSKTQDLAVGEITSGFSFSSAITLKITGQGAASNDLTHRLTTINFEQVA